MTCSCWIKTFFLQHNTTIISDSYSFLGLGLIMPQVAVITDGTAYLPRELIEQYNITIAPLSIIWWKTYREGEDIRQGDFQKRLAISKNISTTSKSEFCL